MKQVTQVFQVFLNSDKRVVLLCVQVLNISLLLFRVAPSLLYKMKCFSFKQIFFVDGLHFVPLPFIFQLTSWVSPLSFKSQMWAAREDFVRFWVFDNICPVFIRPVLESPRCDTSVGLLISTGQFFM